MNVGDKVSIAAFDHKVWPAQVTRVQEIAGGFGAALHGGDALGGDRWLRFDEEGVLWAHGWDGAAVGALRTVVALSSAPNEGGGEGWLQVQEILNLANKRD